jgi:hypothetical protein
MNAKPMILAAAAWAAMAGPAVAQQGGVTLNGGAAPAGKTCVQVEISGQTASSLNCLNQELQAQALAAQGPSLGAPPLGAGSPSNAVGVFNQFGVAEQYGKNFGVSVQPYRPPAPVFASGVH